MNVINDITIVIPTRGLIFARTLKSVEKYKPIIIVEGLPIPESHNECVRQALMRPGNYIMFVEDDMAFDPEIIEKMYWMKSDIVCIDYPMDNGYSTICKQNGEIIWGGLGCTMIHRKVFETEPYFDTSHSWRIKEPFELEKISNPSKYGGHDINFCMEAREKGFTIHQLDGEVKHLRCTDLVKKENNKGGFDIYALDKVSKHQNY